MKRAILFILLLVLPAVLAVAEPTITWLEPIGGDLCLERMCQIKWTVSDFSGKVKIVLLKGADTVGVIANDLAATPSTYNWKVGECIGGPLIEVGGIYKIRVRSVGPGPSDQSNELTLNKCFDLNILRRLRALQTVGIKWPPEPDPWFEFDMIKIRDIMGDPTSLFKVQLLKNGVLLQELGSFGRGKLLPNLLKVKLQPTDSALLRQNEGKFKLALVGENGSILNEFELEGGQQQLH